MQGTDWIRNSEKFRKRNWIKVPSPCHIKDKLPIRGPDRFLVLAAQKYGEIVFQHAGIRGDPVDKMHIDNEASLDLQEIIPQIPRKRPGWDGGVEHPSRRMDIGTVTRAFQV